MSHGEVSYGEVSLWRSVLTAKYPYGEVSVRQSVRMAKCPYGEMSYGEMTYGESRFRWGRGGQLPTSGCPRLSNSPTLVFEFVMHYDEGRET